MEKVLLIAIVEELNNQKSSLEKEDGHKIKSISMSEDYNQNGNIVHGLSVQFSEEVRSGTFALLSIVEKTAQKPCQWFRFSPKGFFFYFE